MNAQAMTERFELRLGTSTLERVDSWRAEQIDAPSRAEAVRRLVDIGLGSGAKKKISLSEGEKLVLMMLCQLFKDQKVKSEIEPEFIEEVIYGGHYWALDWKYSGLFHSHEDSEMVVSEVVNILDMWYFLEHGYAALGKAEKDRIAAEAEPFGRYVKFSGFDGNGESEHIGVAKCLIDDLGRFAPFKGRDLNSHSPSLDGYRRMLSVFEPIRTRLIGRDISADEIIQVIREQLHPSRRKR